MTPTYTARNHLAWLLDQPAFLARLGALATGDERDRVAGRPWREVTPGTEPVDEARFRRYRNAMLPDGKVASVLPESMRPLVVGLARHPRTPVNVPVSRSLDNERAAELQRLCLLRLDPDGRPFTAAERKRFGRYLGTIDPVGCAALLVEGRVSIADAVHVSATSAAVGSYVAVPAAPGFPRIGTVASIAEPNVLHVLPDVQPFRLAVRSRGSSPE